MWEGKKERKEGRKQGAKYWLPLNSQGSLGRIRIRRQKKSREWVSEENEKVEEWKELTWPTDSAILSALTFNNNNFALSCLDWDIYLKVQKNLSLSLSRVSFPSKSFLSLAFDDDEVKEKSGLKKSFEKYWKKPQVSWERERKVFRCPTREKRE